MYSPARRAQASLLSLTLLGAVIGARTSRDLIRTGAKSARVSAVFQQLPALPWFDQQDIHPDENGQLLVERSIQPDGKTACRVNGRPILVSQLRELGQQLLNIHASTTASVVE